MTDALSIVLPTYNRARFLDAALTQLVTLVAPYDIRILVSDNKSTDDTAEVVARHAATYPLVEYACNNENLGLDGNFEAAFKRTSTRYVWLLGDTYLIEAEALSQVMAIAEGERAFDVIVVDVEKRAANVPKGIYTDSEALLVDLGWHMTCMSALILNQDLIQKAAFERYRSTLFIHLGITLEHIANRVASIMWLPGLGTKSLIVEGETKVSWETRWFDVWVDKWIAFVMSLPAAYSLRAKLLCILRHGQYSRAFSFPFLIKLRGTGVLTLSEVTGRWAALHLATGRQRFLILACAFIPRPVANLATKVKEAIR